MGSPSKVVGGEGSVDESSINVPRKTSCTFEWLERTYKNLSESHDENAIDGDDEDARKMLASHNCIRNHPPFGELIQVSTHLIKYGNSNEAL